MILGETLCPSHLISSNMVDFLSIYTYTSSCTRNLIYTQRGEQQFFLHLCLIPSQQLHDTRKDVFGRHTHSHATVGAQTQAQGRIGTSTPTTRRRSIVKCLSPLHALEEHLFFPHTPEVENRNGHFAVQGPLRQPPGRVRGERASDDEQLCSLIDGVLGGALRRLRDRLAEHNDIRLQHAGGAGLGQPSTVSIDDDMALRTVRQDRRPLETRRARRVAERRVRRAGDVGIAVRVGLEALLPPLVGVLGVEGATAQQVAQERGPRGIQLRQARLEGVAVHLLATAQTDQLAQVPVQLHGAQTRMCHVVEAVHVLRHHRRHHSQLPQIADRNVPCVRL